MLSGLIIVAILVIVLIMSVQGYKTGFVAYVSHASAGVIGCIIGIIVCSTSLPETLYEATFKTKAESYISEKVDVVGERIGEYTDVSRAVDDVYKNIGDEALSLMSMMGFEEDTIKGKIEGVLVSDIDLTGDKPLSDHIVESFVAPVFITIAKGLIFIVSYLLSYIAMAIIGVALRGLMRSLKVTSKVDRIAGMCCGLICGVTYSLIVVIIANVFSLIGNFDIGVFNIIHRLG